MDIHLEIIEDYHKFVLWSESICKFRDVYYPDQVDLRDPKRGWTVKEIMDIQRSRRSNATK
jgi:hypothetical protein